MTGSTRKRGSTWTAYYFVPVEDGRRRQMSKGGFRTKREAQEYLTGVLHAIRTGTFVASNRQTLGDYFDLWISGAPARLRPATVDKYARDFDRYVRPVLGSVRLQALTALQLDRLYASLLQSGGAVGRGLSTTSVVHVHAVLHRVLRDAVRKGAVIRNVAEAASPPRQLQPAERKLAVWSGDELRRFLAHVQRDRLFALWRLYAVSGCRRGEAIAARWEDLDLGARRWEIHRALGVVNGAPRMGVPKSGRGRVVALDAATVAALQNHLVRQREERLAWGPAYQDHGLVFCRENGTPLHPNVVTHVFVRLAAEAGLPRIRLHDIRHSAVTAMLRSGVSVKAVSERVGHASTSFTQDVYATVLPDMQRDAAERMAAALDDPQ
jgi:integrase